MKKIILLLVAFVALAAFFYFRTAKNFVNCEFAFDRVSSVVLADVDITNVKSLKKLNLLDGAKLLSALGNKEATLDLGVDLNVKNPNDEPARLDGMDYILYIDERKVVEGSMEQQVLIDGMAETKIVLPCKVNVHDILSSDNIDSIADFAFGVANNNVDTKRMKIDIKPYFTIAGKTVKFPTYITIRGDQMLSNN